MNKHTELYRQVHPKFVDNGEFTSQTFFLFPKDQGRLSVYDGSLISANKAYIHFTSLGYCSVGVAAVTVKDCLKTKLTVKSDPDEFREHVVIIFPSRFGNNKRKMKRIAGMLRKRAYSYGWKYGPFLTITNEKH